MSLKDRFRIDELTRIGSKAIPRKDDGSIEIIRSNGEEVNSSNKSSKPFGTEPIKGDSVNPRTKEDTVNPKKKQNPNKKSFSGETSTHIEKPIYNEEELQRAIDVTVDELIKEKKPPRGEFIRKDKFDAKVEELTEANNEIQELKTRNSELESQITSLSSQIQSLESELESIRNELITKDELFNNLLTRFNNLLADFQNVVIKSTREAVERTSLSGQVRGLQAQKETLSAQLAAQRGINNSLQAQIDTLNRSIESSNSTFQGILSTTERQLEQTQEQLTQTQDALEEEREGKIICNELYRQGYLEKYIWAADEKFGEWLWETNRKTAIGYTIWARKVVKFMQKNPQYTKYIYKFLKPWTLQMAYQMGVVAKSNLAGWLTMKIGWWFSNLVYIIYGARFEKILNRLNRIY